MSSKPKYYNFLWRWHLYAGIIITPIILIMAITGGVYLLQPQIEDLMYGDRLYLSSLYNSPVDHDAVIKAAIDHFNPKKLHSYQPPSDSNQSAQVVLTTQAGDKLTIFLHPASHEVIGTVNEDWRLMNIARNIHKGLLLGTTGRAITELAACWLIIMIGTGFLLWWPRGVKDRGTLIPNTKATGRKLWREFHAVPGAWVGLWILALLITGLPWSLVWGGMLGKVATQLGEGFPKAVFEARPMSLSDAKLPEISMNRIISIVSERNAPAAFKIDYPWWGNGSYALMPLRHGSKSEDAAYIFLDRRSGEVISDYRWKDLGKVGRLTSLGVAFHEGRLFGRANQLINLTAVIVLMSMCITGPIMWWKRRSRNMLAKNSMAIPRLPEDFTLPKTLVGIIFIAGILMPLFGLSLLVIWLGKLAAERSGSKG